MNTITKSMCIASMMTLGLFAGTASAQAHEDHSGHAHSQQTIPAAGQVIQLESGPEVVPQGISGPSAKSILLFKETTVSTGEILDIESVPVEFEFKNTGSEPLEIQLIKPSCGCTVPDMEQKIYQPGEKGTMKVTFDPSGKKGSISRNITIYTNSTSKPVHTIYLQSFVKPVIITEPRILAFDLTKKGQSATKDFKVYGRFEDFKVTRATTQDSDVFSIEVIDGGKVEKEGDDMWLQIVRVKLLESAKPDSHRGEVTIRTNDSNKPLFSMAMVGRVIGDLALSPVRMTVGRLQVGDQFERQVTLKSNSGKAFEIKAVNSLNVALDAEYTATPVDPEVRNEWTILVSGTVMHPAERFNSQINVITDVADEEELTVQMYGQLQPKRP